MADGCRLNYVDPHLDLDCLHTACQRKRKWIRNSIRRILGINPVFFSDCESNQNRVCETLINVGSLV